jgi:predicted  nucleic acid-binding Zn-ribbon protein
MATPKELKEAERVARDQREVVAELQTLGKDIERCERGIVGLKDDLERVNATHAGRQTTQDDINYLEDLLACAKRKLIWEKQMASLQKRTPDLMKRIEELVNHPQSSPDETTRASMLEALHHVQASMKRLNDAKL